jgi:hypothetical protein
MGGGGEGGGHVVSFLGDFNAGEKDSGGVSVYLGARGI